MSEVRTHEQVVGIIGILAQEANDDGVNEREELGPQTRQAIEWLSATDAALRAALETERLRLAACGVAALSNTDAGTKERIGAENPYYSASYADVCAAVDREIALRAALAAAEKGGRP